MAETLTVVRCRTCRRSEDLLLRAGRSWCAPCRDWADIESERVQVVAAAAPDDSPSPSPAWFPAEPPRQPLRVTDGWTIDYNNALYEIDPLPERVPEDERSWVFKEDMLQATHARFNRMLDLGWFPEGDLVVGSYRLVLHEGDFSGPELYAVALRDRVELVAEIERLLAAVSNQEL